MPESEPSLQSILNVNWDVLLKDSILIQSKKRGNIVIFYVWLLIFYLDVRGRNYLIFLISDFLQCQLGDPLPGSSASIWAETILHTFRTWGIYSDVSVGNSHVFGYGVDSLRSIYMHTPLYLAYGDCLESKICKARTTYILPQRHATIPTIPSTPNRSQTPGYHQVVLLQ